VRAVSARAGVNERTVYRHFANEEALRDAIMHRLEQQVGIDLGSLRIEEFADATARIFRHVSTYSLGAPPPLDSTLAETNRRRHDALLAAVKMHAETWSSADRTLVAAIFDLMWSLAAYERFVRDWNLDPEEAIRGMTWVVGVLEKAIRHDIRPPRRSAESLGESDS